MLHYTTGGGVGLLRRCYCIVIFVSLFLVFAVVPSAAYTLTSLPSQYFTLDEDGNTVLYLDTAGSLWDDERRDFLRDWVASDRRLISVDSQDIRFTILPSSYSIYCISDLTVSMSTADVVNDPIRFLSVRYYLPRYPYVWPPQVSPHNALQIGFVVQGDYCNVDLSALDPKYFCAYQGDLILKDSAGIFAPLDPPPPPPPPPEPEPEPVPPPTPPPPAAVDWDLLAISPDHYYSSIAMITEYGGKIVEPAIMTFVLLFFAFLAVKLAKDLLG